MDRIKLFAIAVAITVSSINTSGQTTNSVTTNIPFGTNPKSTVSSLSDGRKVPDLISGSIEIHPLQTSSSTSTSGTNASIKTEPIEKSLRSSALRYTVGSQDVLDIYIERRSVRQRLYTVSEDGTIDFPFAEGMIFVAGKTPNEIAKEINGKVSLFPNANFIVDVKERASHSVEVIGSVATPGIIHLQRDAVPLYVLNALVTPNKQVRSVKIVRVENGTITEQVHEFDKASDIIILPHDRVDYISSENSSVAGYFYVTGQGLLSIGRRDFTTGLTLSAVIDNSLNPKGGPKRVRFRERSTDGTLKDKEFEIKALRDGMIADIRITQGSIVEFLD